MDAVINHMTGPAFSKDSAFGTASGGGNYNYLAYPPFPNAGDFHDCAQDIGGAYHDRGIVQNCRLVGLADLDTGAPHVQDTLAGYLTVTVVYR